MQITRVRAFPIRRDFVGGGFKTAYGRRRGIENLLLAVETGDGLVGHGEACQWTGAAPAPAAPAEIPAMQTVAEAILGADARCPSAVIDMATPLADDRRWLVAALDMALWDLLGRRLGAPVVDLLGGRRGARLPCYVSIGQGEPAAMAAAAAEARRAGYRRFQMKVGDALDTDLARIAAIVPALDDDAVLLVDANGGWSVEIALAAVAAAPPHPGLIWEQPCASYEERRELRRRTGAALMLDQALTGLDVLARALAEDAISTAAIKPTTLAGLTGAAAAVALCAAHGVPVKIDDSWGAETATAAGAHLALSVAPDLLLAGIDMSLYFEGSGPATAVAFADGAITLGNAPGLGVAPRPEDLAGAVVDVG